MLADLGRKDQASAVSELNVKSFGMGHRTGIPHGPLFAIARTTWESRVVPGRIVYSGCFLDDW